jgi:hypothetical protein
MSHRREPWFDEAAGPLVRPYALTRGRTGDARHQLDIVTLVVVLDPARRVPFAEPEYAEIIRLCCSPLSVAEVSAKLGLSFAVTKILVSDLITEGALIFRSPPPAAQTDRPDINLLRAVLDGVRRL